MDFFDSYTPESNISNPDIENRYSFLDFSGPTNYSLQSENPEFYKAHMDFSQNMADWANARDYINTQLIKHPEWAESLSTPEPTPEVQLPETNIPEETTPTPEVPTTETTPEPDKYSWLDTTTPSISEELTKKAQESPLYAQAGIPTEPRELSTPEIPDTYPVEKDFGDSFIGNEIQSPGYYDKKGTLITDPSEITRLTDLKKRKNIMDYSNLDGEIISNNLNADQIKTIAGQLNAIPENRNTLEKILDWGTNFISFGAKPDMPGRDIPVIKDVDAFTQAVNDGADPKELAVLAFEAASGVNPKSGLDYYKLTGDTNNNPYAELAQKEIVEAYNDVLSGDMSIDDFTTFSDKVLDSPLRHFNSVVLNDMRKNFTRGAAMAVGAGAGEVLGRAATKIATKYPKVIGKVLEGNSKHFAEEMTKGSTNPATLSKYAKVFEELGIPEEQATTYVQNLFSKPETAERFIKMLANNIQKSGNVGQAVQNAASKLFISQGTKVGGALAEEAVAKAKEVIGKGTSKAVAGIAAAAPTIAGTIAAGVGSEEEAEAESPFQIGQSLTQAITENKDELNNETLKPVHKVLMGEDDFDDVFTRMLGQFDFDESNEKAGQKFEESTNNFKSKASEIWNDENRNIVSKTGSLIKELYNYAKEMKDTTLTETSAGKVSTAWKDFTMDILRIIFQGYALANGMDEAAIIQILSNASRTGLIDQILEWGGDLDDDTRKGLEGLREPDDILQPEKPITEVEEQEIKRYDTNARDDSTLYNKGLRKEAYSDENIKDFISRVIPNEPILLKVSRFL